MLINVNNKIIKYKFNLTMSRPIGSKNKIKGGNNFMVINLNKQIDSSPEINDRGSFEYVPWGVKNDYPMQLLNLYYNSIIHHSCVDFLSKAICGEKIKNLSEDMLSPNTYETWENFLSEIALSYVLFNAFAFQIIRNKDGKTFSFYNQPIPTIRVAKKDENGEIKKAYLSQDWTQTALYRPIEIDIFNFLEGETIKSGKPYLFIFYKNNPFDMYYSTPEYVSAIPAIKSDISMEYYDFNATQNSFTPSGIVELNQVADEEERKSILKNLKDTFTGAKNASNLIITFRNSNEDKPIEFTPIQADHENINKFADTNDRIINRIIAAHKIPNKSLIGMPVESQGFSDQGNILEVSFNLLEKITVSSARKTILAIINKCFSLNNINVLLEIEPLSFNLKNIEDEKKVIVEKTNDKISESDSQDENNEDKKSLSNE